MLARHAGGTQGKRGGIDLFLRDQVAISTRIAAAVGIKAN